MSLLDVAAAAPVKRSSGPMQYVAVRPAIFDDATNRTYQLVSRVSDEITHCVSRAGNHPSDLLDVLNKSRKLAHQRDRATERSKDTALSADVRKAAKAESAAQSEAVKALPSLRVTRTDDTARMFLVYSARGIE